MKTMILIENEAERAQVETIWGQIKSLQAEGVKFPTECDMIENAVVIHNAGCTDLLSGEGGAIVYVREGEGDDSRWHIYNFNTLKDEVIHEFDLAGLCNSAKGNFPFFN